MMQQLTPEQVASATRRLFHEAAGMAAQPVPQPGGSGAPLPSAPVGAPGGDVRSVPQSAPHVSSSMLPRDIASPALSGAPLLPFAGGPFTPPRPVASITDAATASDLTGFAHPGGHAVSQLPLVPPSPTFPRITKPLFPAEPMVAPSELDGLKGFIARIRADDSRNASLFCPERQPPRASGASVGTAAALVGSRPLDLAAIRRDFPALHQSVHGHPLVWLDNAATTQKPQVVIDAVSRFYERDNSNIHRAAHTLAARATDGYEGARRTIQQFLGAGSPEEIVFVRGTTEGINLVANTYGRKHLQAGDEIVLTTLEHHANIVPWQLLAREKGLVLRVVPVNDRGEILLDSYQALLGPRTKFVALTHASNSLGTILPIADMIAMAKRHGAAVLIDGAQTVAHLAVDVQALGCDFFVFSGHKIFGPTGIGAVYGTKEAWADLPPWQGGGNMIQDVTFEETRYNEPPARFEAGTPNIADAIGLGVALDYLGQFNLDQIAAYEHELLHYATERLVRIPGLRLVGTAAEKVGVLSFVLKHQRPEDVGRQLDLAGIAVRSGHHCSQPSLRRFGLEATVRPSLCFYNTREEVDRLADAVQRIARQSGG